MIRRILIAASSAFCFLHSVSAFEGRITVTLTRGGETQTLLYLVGTNQLRIERGETDHPYPRNIVNLDTGELTLLFPHNRSFVRLKDAEPGAASPPGIGPQIPGGDTLALRPAAPPAARIGPANPPGMRAPPAMPSMPAMPRIPPGAGPQSSIAGVMPAMPMMPMMPLEKLELKATGGKTNLLGFACEQYEIKQHGETMEIWATEQLFPFHPYLQNQPHRFSPRMIEEQWGEMLKAEKLFPLLAVLKFDPGPAQTNSPPINLPERMRFEVKTFTPGKIKKDDAEKLFQPPPDYQEIEPLPF